MSLSFPPAPTNGQQYQNWVWSSTTNSWNPNYAAGFVTSVDGMSGAVNLKGRLIELSRQVVPRSTPVTSLQFTNIFTTTYDEYELHAYGFSPTATNSNVYVQLIGSSGVIGNASSYTASGLWIYGDGTTGPAIYGQAGPSGVITNSQTINSPGGVQDVFGEIVLNIWQPSHPTARKMIWVRSTVRIAATQGTIQNIGAIFWNEGGSGNTPAVTGIALSYGTGQIQEGTFVLYGLIK